MRKVVVYGGLLLSAFSPLLLALALLHAFRAPGWIAWVLVAGSLLPIAFLGLFLRVARAVLPERQLVPVRVRRQDERVLAFVASYLLPIATSVIAVDQWGWVATSALVLLLVLIYLRGNLIHLNPVLSAIGYRLYGVELKNGVEVVVLSRRRRLSQSGPIDGVVELTDETYIQRGK